MPYRTSLSLILCVSNRNAGSTFSFDVIVIVVILRKDGFANSFGNFSRKASIVKRKLNEPFARDENGFGGVAVTADMVVACDCGVKEKRRRRNTMTATLKEVCAVFDVESDLHYIDVLYTKYVEKANEYQDFREYIQCRAKGTWTSFKSETQSIRYSDFLHVMVTQTLEVVRRKCELALDDLLEYGLSTKERLRVIHCARILEPSFYVWIDTRSRWQNELAKHMIDALRDLIDECDDVSRLGRLFSVLKCIEAER